MNVFIESNPVRITIGGGGGAPAPTPAPAAVYDNWIAIESPCITGFATDDFEEVQDGD